MPTSLGMVPDFPASDEPRSVGAVGDWRGRSVLNLRSGNTTRTNTTRLGQLYTIVVRVPQ